MVKYETREPDVLSHLSRSSIFVRVDCLSRKARVTTRWARNGGDNIVTSWFVSYVAVIPRHLYIANLAAADVLICLLALPGTLWWLAHGWSGVAAGVAGGGVPAWAYRRVASVALCRGLPALQNTCTGAAAGTVAAIALDRYRAIVTRAHDATRSRRAVPRVIAAIWAASCALALPLVVFHVSTVTVNVYSM